MTFTGQLVHELTTEAQKTMVTISRRSVSLKREIPFLVNDERFPNNNLTMGEVMSKLNHDDFIGNYNDVPKYEWLQLLGLREWMY